MNESALVACCYSRWVFWSTCYYKLLHFHIWAIVWFMLSLLFLAIPTGFVLNKCVLWLQSRSCFTGNFWYLILSNVYWKQGLNFAKFFTPWSCLLCVIGSRAEVVLRQFLLPDSVERFSLVWVLRLAVLSLGGWGVVFLLVLVRCLGKYYSYVGHQISPSPS